MTNYDNHKATKNKLLTINSLCNMYFKALFAIR